MGKSIWLKKLMMLTLLAVGCFAVSTAAGAEGVTVIEYTYYENGVTAMQSYSLDDSNGYVNKGYMAQKPWSFVLNPAGGSTNLSYIEVIDAWQKGMNEWNRYLVDDMFTMNNSIDFTAEASYDNINTIAFGKLGYGKLAVTTTYMLPYDDGGSHPAPKYAFEADIVFSTSVDWTDVSKYGSGRDLQSIATHELGHTLGLGDVYDANYSYVTMYGLGSINDIGPRTLDSLDLIGLSKYYRVTGMPSEPTATPTAAPTAEPTLKPTEGPTAQPTLNPTAEPTAQPTLKPTAAPDNTPTPAPRYAKVNTNGTGLNMRSQPNTNSARITSIPYAATITVLDYGQTWSKVSYNAYTGYVMTQYIKLLDGSTDEPTKPTAQPTLQPTTQPTSKPSDDTVSAIVNTNGTGLNMRSQPSTGSARVTTIPYAAKITVLEQLGTWSKVSYKTYTGYVMTQYIKITSSSEQPNVTPQPSTPGDDSQADYATVSTSGSNLNIRVQPSFSAAKLTSIPNGSQVMLLARGADWCKIKYGSYTGYVASEYLRFN